MASKAVFDSLRSIAFGDISGTYAAIGSALTVNARILCITNTTDKAMIISTDSSNAAGQIVVPASGYKLFDLTSNLNVGKDDSLFFPSGVTIYVKQVAAPGSGAVYVEVMYGQ